VSEFELIALASLLPWCLSLLLAYHDPAIVQASLLMGQLGWSTPWALLIRCLGRLTVCRSCVACMQPDRRSIGCIRHGGAANLKRKVRLAASAQSV